MLTIPPLFFEATQNVTVRMGELFNFVFSTAASLWNLRWQVQGFVAATGKPDHYQLHERFVKGSGITSADLVSACITMTWEEQQEQFAKFVLFEICGLYEAWLEDVVPRSVRTDVDGIIKSLQFPTRRGQRNSFQRALRAVNAHVSPTMKQEFFPALKAHKKNTWAHIEDLLIAYRYFKEVRNAVIHCGGVADQKVIDARSHLSPIPPSNLGLEDPFELPVLTTGTKVRVGFRNVTGFSNIVHRLIVTLDATLAVSKVAENDLIVRFRSANKNPHALSKTDPVRRNRRLLNMLSKAHIPRPVATTLLDATLVCNGVIF